MLGRCILWQGPGKGPGTANSATFLPLKISSVVLTCGPSPVITRNFASGSLSPTWIAMVVSPLMCGDVLEHFAAVWKACPGLGAAFFTLLRRVGTVPNTGV